MKLINWYRDRKQQKQHENEMAGDLMITITTELSDRLDRIKEAQKKIDEAMNESMTEEERAAAEADVERLNAKAKKLCKEPIEVLAEEILEGKALEVPVNNEEDEQ